MDPANGALHHSSVLVITSTKVNKPEILTQSTISNITCPVFVNLIAMGYTIF
jgi:hypothetical protein